MKATLAVLAAVAGGWLLINLIGALIVGAIARAVIPGEKVGWFTTIVVGFLGGALGKLVVRFGLGWHHLGIVKGFLVSVVGAIVLLLVHRIWKATRKSGAPRPAGA